jgi:hypothetical protein
MADLLPYQSPVAVTRLTLAAALASPAPRLQVVAATAAAFNAELAAAHDHDALLSMLRCAVADLPGLSSSLAVRHGAITAAALRALRSSQPALGDAPLTAKKVCDRPRCSVAVADQMTSPRCSQPTATAAWDGAPVLRWKRSPLPDSLLDSLQPSAVPAAGAAGKKKV